MAALSKLTGAAQPISSTTIEPTSSAIKTYDSILHPKSDTPSTDFTYPRCDSQVLGLGGGGFAVKFESTLAEKILRDGITKVNSTFNDLYSRFLSKGGKLPVELTAITEVKNNSILLPVRPIYSTERVLLDTIRNPIGAVSEDLLFTIKTLRARYAFGVGGSILFQHAGLGIDHTLIGLFGLISNTEKLSETNILRQFDRTHGIAGLSALIGEDFMHNAPDQLYTSILTDNLIPLPQVFFTAGFGHNNSFEG